MIHIKNYICEFIGTFVLVLFGCGTAAIIGKEVGTVGIALAFGLSIIAMAYVIGETSGCHINPAVSLAMFITKKLPGKDFVGYVISQLLGGIAGAGILALIIKSTSLDSLTVGLGTNGYGDLSSVNINVWGALAVEIILTCVFVLTVLGVTSDKKNSSVSGLVIGLTLTFVHILGIPLTGTSVNPARSIGPALFVGGDSLKQVWVFIVGPLLGAVLAAEIYKAISKKTEIFD